MIGDILVEVNIEPDHYDPHTDIPRDLIHTAYVNILTKQFPEWNVTVEDTLVVGTEVYVDLHDDSVFYFLTGLIEKETKEDVIMTIDLCLWDEIEKLLEEGN